MGGNAGEEKMADEVGPSPPCRVVPMRAEPPLTDIARCLANRVAAIESGELQPEHVVLISRGQDDRLQVFEYGRCINPHHTHGVLAHAMEIVASHFPREGD